MAIYISFEEGFMNKFLIIVLGILMAGIVAVPNVSAVGLGFYLEGGGGSGEHTINPDLGPNFDEDVDVRHGGVGFMLDTDVLNKGVFNYRLNVGFEGMTIEPDTGGNDLDLGGIVIMNDFGFAIVRNKKLRFWGGPEIKLGIYSGEDNANQDIDLVTFGVGPVLGLNIRLSSSVFLALKGGVLITAYGGQAETYDIEEGRATVGFFNVGLLFD